MIKDLRLELRATREENAKLQLKAAQTRDAATEIGHLEEVIARQQETITEQEQTIENLAADNALLKRSLFGSRRERFTGDPDPAQTLLFDATSLDSPSSEEEIEPATPGKKQRTSQGRRARVFPELLPREEQRHYLDREAIPEPLRDNPHARRFFKKVGETLELVPMQLKVIEQFQEVIALDGPDETTTMVAARRPAALIQSFAGPSLWAYLTVSRFADHLSPGRHPGTERLPYRPQHAMALDAWPGSRSDTAGGSDVGACSTVRRAGDG